MMLHQTSAGYLPGFRRGTDSVAPGTVPQHPSFPLASPLRG
jgi:hypothetical protein